MEATMRAVTVYQMDYGRKAGYRTRHPICCISELRKHERVNNYNDLIKT